jgi:hypothetical protein
MLNPKKYNPYPLQISIGLCCLLFIPVSYETHKTLCEQNAYVVYWLLKHKKQSHYTPWRRLGGEEV